MTKLPLTKGYHVVISSRDMDFKKKIKLEFATLGGTN